VNVHVRDPETVALTTGRWENGSDFHLSLEAGRSELPWKARSHSLWGSGRDALRALLARGRDVHGWSRLLVPSYYCQDVLAAVGREIAVNVYRSAPTEPVPRPIKVRAGDVVLVVATFGMRTQAELSGPAPIVEDHSHDPTTDGAMHSSADYVIASLRKTLPLPDGGVLWSPRNLPVPQEIKMTVAHGAAVLQRLSAMTLKLHYLSGQEVAKASFRELAIDGEQAIGADAMSGISPFSRSRLTTFPTARWREVRARNLQVLQDKTGDLPLVRLLDVSFAATLIFDEEALRERVRERLIAARIYPSVLWPLDDPFVEGIPESHVDLSRRILSIHCDQRYSVDDMVRVASELRKAVAQG
jgi:hypothetical protein